MAKAETQQGGDSQVKEFRDWFAYADGEWDTNRREGRIDMRYIAGDPWDDRERRAREKASRPVLTFDELGQYINQVVNDVRANPIAVKFSPVGMGASEQSAEWYGDKMREIEYRSNAQVAYTTAFENACQRGFGYVKVTTRWEHDRSANQDIWLEGIPNPELVTPDPDAILPDSSDQRRVIIRQPYTHAEFRRRFGSKSSFESFGREEIRQAKQWVDVNSVYVGEVWDLAMTAEKLLIVTRPGEAEPVGVFASELEAMGGLPDGAQVHTERQADVPKVTQYLTNGLEILDTRAWAGKYIPIVSCFGKILYVEDGAGAVERRLAGMVRLARDPYMLYCYYRTTEAEIVSMTPKFPWFVYKGTLDTNELAKLRKANREPVAVIQVESRLEGLPVGQPPPFPQRNPYEPPIAALEVGAESARRGIQAAMGFSPLPTDAQRVNQKSGVALRKIESAGERGSFHFRDHYHGMIRQVGVVVEDLLDKIYDTPRQTGVRRQNDTSDIVAINVPGGVSTKGSHLVTVSTGPAFDSQREQASEFADILMQSPLAPRIADLAVKLKNLGPVGDELAKRLTPPEFVQEGKDGKPDPAKLTQQLAMMAEKLKQVEAFAMDAKQKLETDAMKAQAQLAIEHLRAEKEIYLESMKQAGKIDAARITAAKASIDEAAAAREEIRALALDHAHEATESERDRQHEAAMAERGHAQALEQGAQASDSAMAMQAAKTAADTAYFDPDEA